MENKELEVVSKKLNALISISLRQLFGDKEFTGAGKRRKQGIGEMAHYLADMGIDAKDIAVILDAPLTSVRTLLTPKRRK